MNILRLSTLSLTLVIAVISLGYANPSFAAPSCSKNPSHPDCIPDSAGITYSVELMGRVFHFAPPGPVKDDGALLAEPAVPLIFSRPTGDVPCDPNSDIVADEAACAWDAVFAACENFFGPNPIPGIGPTAMMVSGFTSPAGDWSIDKAGGVRLAMSIPFDSMGDSPPGPGGTYFSVHLQLIGDTFFDSPHAPWLPAPGSSIPYNIVDFWITGGTAKGIRPKKGCVSGGVAEVTDFDFGQVRTLVITAPPE